MYFAAAVLTVLAGLFYAAGNQSVHMVRTSAVRAARSAPHYVLVGAGLAASGRLRQHQMPQPQLLCG
jgi:hypothetical protein